MSTATQTGYREMHLDSSRATFTGEFEFDLKKRRLELILSQTMPDEDADPFENLVLPLTVVLVELIPSSDSEGPVEGYEDIYSFSHDGDFMGHLYRSFTRPSGGHRTYTAPNFAQDGDITKLYRYGEHIKDMMERRRLSHILEKHPSVQKLKTHTLWK